MGRVVDMGRVQAAMARLEAVLVANPSIAGRTAAYLNGNLKGEPMELVKDTKALRVPDEFNERADALIEPLAKDTQRRAFGRVSRAAVLRLAIAKGLEALEAEYGLQSGKAATSGGSEIGNGGK